MMTIQWNMLRVGDSVLVHVDNAAELTGATVAIVTAAASPTDANEVSVRVENSEESWYMWPRPDEVHAEPLHVTEACTRCAAAI